MKKLAVFVEGLTECLFVERLVRSMIDETRVKLEVRRGSGGSRRNKPRQLDIVRRDPDGPFQTHFILIVMSEQDERVATDVNDRYPTLVAENFAAIVAIRDVAPDVARTDVPKLRAALAKPWRHMALAPRFILAVMEVEAWFLREHRHFPRIHASIDCERIADEFEFDPRTDDMQQRDKPSDDLKNVYWLETIHYDKSRSIVERLMNALCFDHIRGEVADSFEDLRRLVGTLEEFLAPEVAEQP